MCLLAHSFKDFSPRSLTRLLCTRHMTAEHRAEEAYFLVAAREPVERGEGGTHLLLPCFQHSLLTDFFFFRILSSRASCGLFAAVANTLSPHIPSTCPLCLSHTGLFTVPCTGQTHTSPRGFIVLSSPNSPLS